MNVEGVRAEQTYETSPAADVDTLLEAILCLPDRHRNVGLQKKYMCGYALQDCSLGSQS